MPAANPLSQGLGKLASLSCSMGQVRVLKGEGRAFEDSLQLICVTTCGLEIGRCPHERWPIRKTTGPVDDSANADGWSTRQSLGSFVIQTQMGVCMLQSSAAGY